jgi:ribosomal protein L28
MLATTKQVRNIVHTMCNVGAHSYTDKSASKRTSETNLRNITFLLYEENTAVTLAIMQLALFAQGYTNKIKITRSKYDSVARQGGSTYLRINNCILEK